MHGPKFSENINVLFAERAPELRFDEDEVLHGFIMDDCDHIINTIPILEYEERYLTATDSESYICLSICSYGRCMESVKIKSSTLFTENAFVSRYGNQPFSAFDKSLWEIFFKTIKVMLPEIEQRVIYGYSGWTKKMDSYLFGSIMIDANNAFSIKSTLAKTDTLLSRKSPTDVCKIVDTIAKSISAEPLVGYIFLMYLELSHSKQRFVMSHHLCPEFVISINGETGSYKTTVSTAFFNTYDGSTASFEDTLASIRRSFQSNKSGITIVDDYKINSKQNDAKYEKIVRLAGDINTTGKYVIGNKVVDELITGMSVITGEKRPQLQQSSYSRILFVDVGQFPINQTGLTELQHHKSEMNSFVTLFIQFILQNPSFDTDCVDLFNKYRDELLKNTSFPRMHGRYYSMYAWFAVMWDVYVKFLSRYGVNVDYDFKTKIKHYILAQHNMYDNNPIKLFKTAYLELVDANEIIVTDKDGVDTLTFDVLQLDDVLFLKSNGAYKKVCKYWQDKGIEFPVSERKLRKLLHEAHILKPKDGHLTYERKTRDNRSYSGYSLFKNYFYDYGGKENDKF